MNSKFLRCFIGILVTVGSVLAVYPSMTATAQTSTNEIDSLLQIVEKLQRNKPDEAMQLALLALQHSEKSRYNFGRGKAHEHLGIIYQINGNFPESLEQYQKALDVFKDDTAHKTNTASIYNLMGILYKNLATYDKALDFYTSSKYLYEEVQDREGLSKTLNNIGNLYRIQGEIKTAVIYFRQSIDLKEMLADTHGLAISYNNLAWVFLEMEQFDSAFFYQRKSLFLRRDDNITGKIHSLNALAVIHQKKGSYDSSLYYATKALDLMREFKPIVEFAKVNQTLYETHKLKNNVAEALHFLEQYKATNDSLFSSEKTLAIAAIEKNLEVAKKDLEIAKEKMVRENQRKFINYLAIILMIALVFISIIIWIRIKEKRANRELQLSHHKISSQSEELQKLNATKDRLFAIIGHDMRSPINSLKNLLDLLQDKMLTPEDFIALSKKLRVGVDSVHFTLNNMLLWANGQMHGIVAKPESFEVKILVNECLELFSDAIQTKEIAVENEIDDALVAYADANQIRVVLRNLLSNAIKYTPQGGKIALSCIAVDNFYEIEVRDTGAGIEESIKESLFLAPINKSSIGTNNEKGTGIGLILCKDFVDSNGGSIRAESKPGKGTSFYFTLPRV